MDLPHVRPGRWPDPVPGGLADTLVRDRTDKGSCRVALIGLPDDTGVRLNHGRPGARLGPDAFRAALAKQGNPFDAATRKPLRTAVLDVGDVTPAAPSDPRSRDSQIDAMHRTHERVRTAVRTLHDQGMLVVAIGGGHDLTLPCVRALSEHLGKAVAGVNFDAHLDVRDRPGSGMPFRKLIEGGFLDPIRHATIGVGRFANSQHDFEWLSSRGAHLVTNRHTDRGFLDANQTLAHVLRDGGEHAFATFDLDALDADVAPGVSARNPAGLSVQELCHDAQQCAADPRVRHLDIMELSPPHDDPPTDYALGLTPGRTARIAALLFTHMLAGFDERFRDGAP
ncbi:MAG: formimidoylglutamase [Planctomycetota bacterium]